MEDAQIKLDTVVSNLHGVSGRAMLAALIAGERVSGVLDQEMRGRLGQLDHLAACGARVVF